jgi:apolipoprotein D and lipocalin family protein
MLRARRPRVLAPPRTNAKAAAFVAPLVSRLLAPTLGREMATLLASVVVPLAFSGGPPKPQTASAVRLRDYAGRWFEIARLGAPFERACARDVSAEYRALPDGRIAVTNRCASRRRRVQQVEGVARALPDSANARLNVSFAPRWLRWLPFAWADYWILDVTPDYSAALVGTPARDSLCLLGRSPDMPQATVERLLARAAAQGYDISALRFVEHSGQHAVRAGTRR